MLTFRNVVHGYLSIWSDTLPLLTPSAVTALNHHFKLPQKLSGKISPVAVTGDPGIQDYISELAFESVVRSRGSAQALPKLLRGKVFEDLARRVADRLQGLARLNLEPSMLDASDRKEITALAKNLLAYLRQRKAKPEFHPSIPGHGVLAECQADISIGHTLVEVKAVTRNLRGSDIRQVFVYLALDAAKGHERWTEVEFFNPKKALVATFNVAKLWGELSGGRPHLQTYSDFLSQFETRDFQPPIEG